MNINSLPEPVLVQTFQYLPIDDLCLSARLVCKHWCTLTYDLSLWKVLDLSGKSNLIDDHIFLGILQKIYPYVEHINIQGLMLTDKAFKHENFICPRLKRIDISGTKISDDALDYLVEKYPNLQQLLFFKCKKIERAYACLSKLKHLQSFYDPYEDCVSRPEILPTEKIRDTFSPTIETVRFSSESFSEDSFVEICKMCPRLRVVQIPGCTDIRDEAFLLASHHLTSITSLDVSRLSGVTDKALKVIAENCPLLEEINVSECRLVTDVGVAQLITSCRNLSRIVLNEERSMYGNITDVGLMDIAEQCCHLEELVCCACPSVTDLGLQAVALRCKQLKWLDVTACLAITDKSLYAIADGCPRIQRFFASECVQLTAKSVNYLIGKCRELREIELQTCMYLNKLQFTNTKVEPHAASHPDGAIKGDDDCRLSVVDLSFCSRLTSYSVEQIAQHCKHLRYLSLRGCHLVNDEAVITVAKCCHLLDGLDIAGGSILQTSGVTDHALRAIANNCKKLEFLSVDKVKKITPDGIQALAMQCCPLYKVYITVGGRSTLKLKQVTDMIKTYRRKCWVYDLKEDAISDHLVGDFILKFLPIRGQKQNDQNGKTLQFYLDDLTLD